MSREEEKYQAANNAWNLQGLTNQEQKIPYKLGFLEGFDYADQHPRKGLWEAEKVIDWLNSWFTDDICKCCLPITKDARNTFFNDLRKAMEKS